MILIELGQDDFDRHGFAIIGRVVNAIAKVIQSDSGLNRFQAEREAWPHILTGVRLGALHPIDQGTRHKLSIDACGDGAVRFDELVEWGRKTELFDFKKVVPIEEKYIAQAAAACDTEQKQPKPKNVQSAEEIKRARRQRLENAILPTTGSGRAVQHRVWAAAQVPDWEFWRDMPEVELWQACALSLNLDPDPLTPSDDGMGMGGESYFKARSFPNEEAWEKFNKRLRLLEANMQRPTVRLADFVTWASSLSTPWDMPPELVALAQKPEALAGKPVPAPTTSAYMEGSDAAPEQLEPHEVERNDKPGQEICDLFDAMNQAEIAALFEKVSQDDWKNHFERAARNGLKEARQGDASPYQYNPAKVADWLVCKGLYARDYADRRLANNLPKRSKDYKHLITGLIE